MRVLNAKVRFEGKLGLPQYSHAIAMIEMDVELLEGEDQIEAVKAALVTAKEIVKDNLRTSGQPQLPKKAPDETQADPDALRKKSPAEVAKDIPPQAPDAN